MNDEKFDGDLGNLAAGDRVEVEGRLGRDHDAAVVEDEQVTGEAFHHPEKDAVATTWEPNFQPMLWSFAPEQVKYDFL
jgi:hypothetical protein